MEDLKVVILQLLVPTHCPPCQLLWGLPISQVFVIGLNDEWLFSPDEVGTPVFQRLDDTQELPFVDVVVLFRGGEGV